MQFQFTCHGCGQQLRIAKADAGQKIQCPECKFVQTIEVPHEPEATPIQPLTVAGELPERNPYQATSTSEETDGVRTADFRHAPLADRGTRLVAAIVDNVLAMLACVPGFILLFSLGFSLLDLVEPEAAIDAGLAFGLFATFLGYFAVCVYNWVLTAQRGETIAKRLFGIRIINVNTGDPPGFGQGVVMRSWLTSLLTQFIPLYGIIDAVVIFGAERRCIHDYFASTVVVKSIPHNETMVGE